MAQQHPFGPGPDPSQERYFDLDLDDEGWDDEFERWGDELYHAREDRDYERRADQCTQE